MTQAYSIIKNTNCFYLSEYYSKFVADFRGALIYGLRLYPLNLNNVMVAKEKAEPITFLRITGLFFRKAQHKLFFIKSYCW
jgi:hypothetical protein